MGQTICNASGDLIIFSNYDGGTLTINVDQNIPNLKIGVCSYEGVLINLTGPFVGNVVAVKYAGYNGSNAHCNNAVINTTIVGAPVTASTSILITPPVTLSDPSGYTSMVCGTGCSPSGGGCNSPAQIVHYFLTSFPGSTLIAHKTQYGCWTGTQSVSAGGNCCPPVPVIPGGISGSQTICAGQTPSMFTSTAAATGGSGTITYSWQSSFSPTSGFTNISGAGALGYSPNTLSVTTYYRRAASTATNNIAYSNVIAVTVNPTPTIIVTGGSGICPNGTVSLLASGALNYTWYPFNLASPQLTLNALSPGSYTVAGVSALGCTATAVRQMSLHAQPVISVTGPSSVCPGTPALLQASGALVYTWSPGNLSGTAITFTPQTTFTFFVTGRDLNNCTNTAVYIQNLFATPDLSVTPGSGMACKGQSLSLTASGAFSYTWSNNSSNIISNPLIITPTASAIYTITGKSQDNCIGKLIFPLSVNDLPVVTASLATQPVCSGQPALLTAGGANNYTWNPGSFVGAIFSFTPAGSVIYSVTGDDGNCRKTTSVNVQVLSSPVVSISASRSVICAGEATKLTASGAGTYSWTVGTAGVVGASVIVNPVASTTFSVTGTATNSCKSIATISVSVSSCAGSGNEVTSDKWRIEVYPNPSRDRLIIQGFEKAHLWIMTIEGRTVIEVHLEEWNNYSMEINRLSPGTYLIKNEGGTWLKQKLLVTP